MGRFMRERGFESYDELWRWSVEDLDGFWGALWDRYDVGERGNRVLASREMPGALWFPGTRLNYTEHALRGKADDALALIAGNESGEDAEWTWGQLKGQVRRIAAGLRRLGVGAGDRGVAYMPNIPQTLAAVPAPPSPRALWASCSPGFRPRSGVGPLPPIQPEGPP